MSALPINPGPCLARVSATPTGWIIDCRGPRAARHFDVRTEGEAAELAIVLRDQGGWVLRFSPGAAAVWELVEELSEGGAP